MNFGYFELIDVIMIFTYALILIGMGIYFTRKSGTAEQFMVAGGSIPARAAGLGQWIQCDIEEITVSELPGVVSAAVQDTLPGFKITETEIESDEEQKKREKRRGKRKK